jgi:hypothetical protein
MEATLRPLGPSASTGKPPAAAMDQCFGEDPQSCVIFLTDEEIGLITSGGPSTEALVSSLFISWKVLSWSGP